MNHRSIPKEEETPPFKVWKKWTSRLVVDHLCHDQIEDAVNSSGKTNPHERIAEWSKALTEKFNSFTDEEKAKYAVIAEQWTKDGPPVEVRRRLVFKLYWSLFALLTNNPSEATEKTGKYVRSILDQLELRLGVHAVMFVTYKDVEGEIKISEYVCTVCCLANLTFAKFRVARGAYRGPV